MKSLIATICILGLVGMIVATAVQADTADVTATVTAQLVSVSVSDGSVVYGTMELSTAQSTALGDDDSLDDTQTATNDGNVNVDLSIRSSDAASGGTLWELAASAGSDEFTHEFCTSDCDSSPTWVGFNIDNATYSTIASDVIPTGSQAFDLRLGTPSFSSDSVEHTVTITVLAAL